MKKDILKAILYPAEAIAAIITVWFIAALSFNKPIILPSPIEAAKEFFNLLLDKTIYLAALGSVLRALLAFIISFIIAAGLSILAQKSEKARRVISPFISFIRALPTMAVILLFLVWTSSQVAPVLVAMLVILPTLYSAMLSSFLAVDSRLIEMAQLYKKTDSEIFFRVILPLSAPSISENAAGALSLSVKLVIAAEVLTLTSGSIGALMQGAQIYFNTGMLLALTAVCIIISAALEISVKLIFRRALKGGRAA